MTRIWIDCEWNSVEPNGFGPLISMALVAEDGREFYAVLGCKSPSRWVAEHVMPVLLKPPVSRSVFLGALELWLWHYQEVEIIADWPQDIQHFCNVLVVAPGARTNTPRLRFAIHEMAGGVRSELPHNALADAQAMARSAGVRL